MLSSTNFSNGTRIIKTLVPLQLSWPLGSRLKCHRLHYWL